MRTYPFTLSTPHFTPPHTQIDMEGYQFFPQQYPPGPRGPIHLTKGAQGAFGEAMAYQFMQYMLSHPKQS